MTDSNLQSGTQPGAAIDYERFLDCVHCGLCTSKCPTYLETGNENDSPRGRIYLMRAVTDGRVDLTSHVARHLELCLDCR
ncbi:MAG: 4Fe-4S dicluster domain-containing protein, partial [Planctomycetaceae bacterium]|nr:4Fe-4S dicluster domain-containing protein [Planctomycetaceae bacterium]